MLNIAIDGHVASGKSAVARAIAERLNIKVLDTGAIYRGLACAFKESTFDGVNEENVNQFIKNLKVEVKFLDDAQHVFVNEKDYTPWLRLEETSTYASLISPYPILRKKVMAIQRDFAKNNDCVMEGRDIGTEVLPNATIKFFVTAREEVRAKRRYDQLKDKGNVDYNQILEDLRARDYKDEHRTVAPLKPAEDSIILDTSDMTFEEVVEHCLALINKKNQLKLS